MRRLLAFLLLAGCSGPDGADPPPREPPREPTREERPASPVLIHPRAVEVGDTVDGLVVVAVDLHPLPGDSTVFAGSVRLQGERELEGVYQPHFDYPDVDALCFHPDAASASRIPRLAPDARSSPGRKRWFCFRNREEAAAAFVPLDEPREARVRVRDYTVQRRFTDAWDEADLVEVLETGAWREATLRDTLPQPRLRSFGEAGAAGPARAVPAGNARRGG